MMFPNARVIAKKEVEKSTMTTKFLTVIMSVIILLASFGTQTIIGQTDEQTARVRTKIVKYGTDKKVSVTLKSGANFKGKIVSISQDGFDVAVKNEGNKSVAFSDVREVKGSSKKKTWIIVGATAGAGFAIYLLTVGRICRNGGDNVFCQ